MEAQSTIRVLTIAGSDCGGGAGIQADLKTFTSLQVYGMSVLTALTAQNTLGVQGIHNVSPEFVSLQIKSIMDDIGVDCVKIGMLSNSAIIDTVSESLKKYRITQVVLDPVMISTSGSRLLDDAALSNLKNNLIPLSLIITPNIPEACTLLGRKIASLEEMKEAVVDLHKFGCKYVLLKGGHLDIKQEDGIYLVDILYDGTNIFEFPRRKVQTKNTHGTGCTLASAIAAYIAKGCTVPNSVRQGIDYVHEALEYPIKIGTGFGPLNHYFNFIPKPPKKQLFQQLIEACSEDWEKYISHNFVQQLTNGTLPIASFKHYIIQDYIFLKHFSRANALVAFKSETTSEIQQAAKALSDLINVENNMHIKFCQRWGISKEQLEEAQEATANMAYTRFVLERGLSGDILDLRVALAPCVIGYGEIGLIARRNSVANNPYQEWIDMYSSDWFQEGVKNAIEELDKLVIFYGMSEQRFNSLAKNFREATRLEIRFWQMGLLQEF